MKRSNIIFLLLLPIVGWTQSVSIIPKPAKMEVGNGYFKIDNNTALKFDAKNPALKQTASLFSSFLKDVSGITIPQNGNHGKSISFELKKISGIGDEGYKLSVSPTSIVVSANTPRGIFFGVQSIIQLLPQVRTNASMKVPSLEITDYPRFQWRGMHLDVVRHFFTPNTVKEYIDLMSTYKFNTLHWHLSDDQGWRLEIKKYPKLTSVGAWRADRRGISWGMSEESKPGEPTTYGGYYTQEQVKDIVRYAQQRNITIVPELDVPGHSGAAIAAYPYLSCNGKAQTMITGGIYPKDYSFTLCVGKDSVYTFMKNVLTEVMQLFPSKYIHIGGDEVDKTAWTTDSTCQRLMRKEHLENVDELQSYFIRKMEKFLVSHGRKLIGWDEILEGGLAPEATVMSWRGISGGIAAAKMHHDVVMTPGEPLYFDHYQAGPEGEPVAIGGMNTLKMVYDYDPIPKELSADESNYVIGAQANLWGEFISTHAHVEYMVLPRMLALAEAVWTPLSGKNYDDFFDRVQKQFVVFDQKGYNYCEGNYNVSFAPGTDKGNLMVSLNSEVPGSTIYYTTDGSYPGVNSGIYSAPVTIDTSVLVRAVVAMNGVVKSKEPSEQSFVKDKVSGLPVIYKFPASSYYKANGPNSLTDGIRGRHAVNRYWHGFSGSDLVATIKMPQATTIHEVTAGFLQRYSDWIFLPKIIEVEISNDGVQFTKVGEVTNTVSPNEKESIIKDFTVTFTSQQCRFIRVSAKNLGVCPQGHPGEGKAAWLFADEIIVN